MMAYHRARRKIARGARGQSATVLSPLEAATLMRVVQQHEHERREQALLGVPE